jgi:hypothetical protein
MGVMAMFNRGLATVPGASRRCHEQVVADKQDNEQHRDME